MDLPIFKRGFELVSSELNKLSSAIRAASVTSVIGGTFTRTPGGTTIIINDQTRGGGGSAPVAECKFQISDATEGESVQIEVGYGTINGRSPDGMEMGTPYILPVTEKGYVYAVVVFDTENLTIPNEPGYVTLSFETEAQPNTDTTVYVLLGAVDVQEGAITNLYSVCDIADANPCSLAWEAPA